MQSSKRLEHTVLNVSINGVVAEKRPSAFSLITDQNFHSVIANLRFPADMKTGKTGDPIMVNLSLAGDKHLLFTGEICSAGIHGAYRELALTDSYKKLVNTNITASYRKEFTGMILQDTLGSAGIVKSAVTCPKAEMARFSAENIPADACIQLLIKALEGHGHKGLRFFFDAEDTFHFGAAEDTGKNKGAVYEFETGKNILRKGEGWIQILPLPIRHSQEVIIDGKKMSTCRTDLIVSGAYSRLRLWLRTAESSPMEAA